VTKAALRDELLAALAAQLATAQAAHAAAVEGATHSEARAENAKDTRGLEQSYVARGHAQRVEELTTALAAVQGMTWRRFGAADAVELGALVTVEEDDRVLRFLVVSHGGGIALARGDVQVVTPQSPIGGALIGRHVDDDVEVRGPGGVRELAITVIA
jgi:transcription elongation GreA/GreB family factor